MVKKKLWQYVKPFSYNTGTWRTDGQTNRQICYINIARQYADARQKDCTRGIVGPTVEANYRKAWNIAQPLCESRDPCLELAMLEYLRFFYPFCHSSQYERKISPVSKISIMSDVVSNNVRCTDWRHDCCILYPVHIRTSHETQCWTVFLRAQCWTVFSWFKKWTGGFLPPKTVRGLSLSAMHSWNRE